MQRHTAARQVNFRLKHSRHAFKKFAELIVEPNLEQRLADAVRNPQSDNAKELVRKVVPLTCMIGSSIPYSAAARKSFFSQFTGSMYRFGIGFIFASAAFDDKNHVFCFRLSTQHRSNETFPAKDAGFREHMHKKETVFNEHSPDHPDFDVELNYPIDDIALLQLASSNPAAAVVFFKTLFEAFIECLLGVTSQHRSNTVPLHHPSRRGIYGIILDTNIVTENSMRGSLHFHCPLVGVFNSIMLQKLVHSPKFMKAIAAVYESMIQAHLPIHIHAENMLKIDNKLVHNAVNFAAEQVPLPPKNATDEERAAWKESLQRRSDRCAMQHNIHFEKHTNSCVYPHLQYCR